MKPRGYILLIQSLKRIPLGAHMLKDMKRALGGRTMPLMAWDIGAAIGFASTEGAAKVSTDISKIVGSEYQILIF